MIPDILTSDRKSTGIADAEHTSPCSPQSNAYCFTWDIFKKKEREKVCLANNNVIPIRGQTEQWQVSVDRSRRDSDEFFLQIANQTLHRVIIRTVTDATLIWVVWTAGFLECKMIMTRQLFYISRSSEIFFLTTKIISELNKSSSRSSGLRSAQTGVDPVLSSR
jgi:hypothetical protein